MTSKSNEHTSGNTTLQTNLPAQATALHSNLSQTREPGLPDARSAAWLGQNQPGLEAFNASVASHGVFSRGRRAF